MHHYHTNTRPIKRSRSIDMINGPIGPRLIWFALPLAFTGILQQLFNAADVAVVGRFVGKEAMAAVGSNTSIISLLLNLFVGISLGANVVISKFIGQQEQKGVRKAVHTSILVAVISGLFLTAFGELLTRPILQWMGVPEQIKTMAETYLRVYLLGMPVILLYNFESAIFRSKGDTRTPLLCLIVSGISNVLLNLFLVIMVHLDVAGVAIATVTSNLIGAGMLLVSLLRDNGDVSVRWSELRIDIKVLKEMLRIGVPSGVQSMMFSLSNILIQSAINSLGAEVMAASSAGFNIEVMAFYVTSAFGSACTTFLGQNFGAGQWDRCRKVTGISMIQNVLGSAMISLGILAISRPLLSIFNQDPDVIGYGVTRLRYILLAQPLNAVIEIISGSMRGYGRSLEPALVSLFGICGVRILWVYTGFHKIGTYSALLTAYPMSWIVTALALVVLYIVFIRRFRTQSEGG